MDGKLLRLLLATISISALSYLRSNCQQSFSPAPSTGNSSEHLRNMLLTDTNLIVGSSTALYRLDLDLVQLQRRVLNAPNRLLVSDPSGTYNRSVLACGSVECVLVSLSDLDATSWEVHREGEVVRNGSKDVNGIFAIGSNGSSDLMVAENEEGNQAARVIRGSLLNVGNTSASYSFRTYAIRPEPRFSSIEFLITFTYQGFIYLVAQFGDTETRIVRFCQSDPSSPIRPTFASQYEITLQCTTDYVGQAISATLVESSSVFPDPTLLVMKSGLVSPGTHEVHVCAYSLVEINQLMLDKFDSCIAGQGVSGFTRDQNSMVCNPLSLAQLATSDPCMLRGSRSVGLEVETPLLAVTPVLTRSLGGGDNYTTLVDAVLDGSLFVFAASHRGLDQFHIRTPTESVYIRHIDLSHLLPPALNESLTRELLASPSGEHIFSLTPSKVLRHTVDMCSSFSTCETCTTSHDPICGWCTLQGSCTRQSSCPPVVDRLGTANTVWLATGMNGSCPVITGASPPTIYFPELASTVDGSRTLSLAMANIDGRYDYQCVFSFNGSPNIFRDGQQNGTSFTCIAPTRGEVPALGEGEDTVSSTVFLRSIATAQTVVSLETPVEFTMCSVHMSCTACIQSLCRWCPFSFECIPEPSKIGTCSAPLNQPSICAGSQCPSILPPSPQERNYLVHANHIYQQSQLRILAANLSVFLEHFERGEFRCEICLDAACADMLAVLPATVNPEGTEVTCLLDRLTVPGTPTPRFNATLRIVWGSDRTIDNPSHTGITVYSCAHLGRNCGECLTIESRYNCAFCGSTCALTQMPACTSSSPPATMLSDPAEVEQCGTPVITSFHPTAGPVDGGTEVTVTGSNLGASAEDIVRVTIGSVNCTIISITPGVSLRCVTDVVVSSRFSSGISISLDYRDEAISSEEQFDFVIPRLSSNDVIHPSQGPLSGGTRITITGSMITVGSSHSVLIASQDCTDVEVTDVNISCVTARSESDMPSLALVTVRVDNWSARTDYSYTEDPEFSSIEPNYSFASGGTNYTVFGQNLNVVLEPRLLLYLRGVSEGVVKRQVEQISVQSDVCRVSRPPLEGISMVCQAPPLPTNLSSAVTIGLLMDGVTSLRQLNATVTVHRDPEFFRNPNQLAFSEGDEIQLLIEGSGFVFSSDQITITITPCLEDICTCDILNISPENNSLLCEVTAIQNLPADETLNVSVKFGNIVALVHQIVITRVGSPLPDVVVSALAAVVVVMVCSVLLLCCVICIYRSRLKKVRRKVLEPMSFSPRDTIFLTSTQTGSDKDAVMEELTKFIPEFLIVPSNQLRISNTIGQGEFGIVYKAHLIKWHGQGDPSTVAVKTLKGLFTVRDVESLAKEVLKMKDFKHPHVMSLIGVCLDAGAGVSVVMPFMANGSLLDYLKREREMLDLAADTETEKVEEVRKLLLKFCLHIAEGMEYLAEQLFVHRDLAARNCMIDAHGSIKVADFGLSEDIYTAGYFRQGADSAVRLPIKWMAVESLRDGVFTEKSDVWSYGVTVWEVFSVGRLPYPGVQLVSLLQLLEDGHRLARPTNTACSGDIYSLMYECWSMAVARPTFSQLVATLNHHLQAVAGYMQLNMVLCEEGEEPIVKGNQAYGPVEPVVEGIQAYGLGEPIVEGNQAYGPVEPVVEGIQAYGLGEPIVEGNQAYGLGEPIVEGNQAYGLGEPISEGN